MTGDLDIRRSQFEFIITFACGVASCESRLQKCVVLSTNEDELIGTTKSCKEMLWMKRFLNKIGFRQEEYTIPGDSHSVIHLSKNASFYLRCKQIDVRYHWVRDVLKNKSLKLT